MKKILVILVAVIGLSISVNAQVCPIEGGNIEVVSSPTHNGSEAIVTVANDSETTSANVTVTVKVSYHFTSNNAYYKSETFSGTEFVGKGGRTQIRIPITSCYSYNHNGTTLTLCPKAVEVTDIRGRKCN
jgi:hypothetical protein